MRRNRWGWGYEERAVELAALRARAAPFLGQLDEEQPVADDALTLPEPRLPIPEALREIATREPLERASHAYGKSYPDRIRGFRGQYPSPPDFVAVPRDEADVARVLETAEAAGLSVVPFGGGSSVVGGVETLLGPKANGVVSLDLRRLDRLLELDPVSRLARFQAGVFGPALEAQLATHGLTLRHFPQSFEFSTLGGWAATRAGGHFATVYTHIDDLVASLRIVGPAAAFETPLRPASGAGPEPVRLLLGSEGILGVITEATVRVRPRPTFRAGASVRFERFDDAVAAARTLAQSGLHPSNCRVLDGMEAMLNGVAMDGSSILVLGFESAVASVRADIDRALVLALAHGGKCAKGASVREGDEAREEDEAASWRASFLDGPYLQDGMIRLGVLADTFETACTWKAFPALHREIVGATSAALREHCGVGLVTCRFTHVYPDGPAPYYTFLGKARRGEELEQWSAVKRAASDALARTGGTITHHHAVGRMHRPWYDAERPEAFADVLRAAKDRFDPRGILNPGVLLDPR